MLFTRLFFLAIGIWEFGNAEKPYDISYFAQKPGVYYERSSNIYLIREQWTMIITVDVGNLLNDRNEDRAQESMNQCSKIVFMRSTCQNVYA